LARIRRFRKNRYNISRQAASLQSICEKHRLALSPDKAAWLLDVLESKAHVSARFRIIRNDMIYRQRKMDDFIFKIIFLTGTV